MDNDLVPDGECERCQVCGKQYLTCYLMPHSIWKQITPKPEEEDAGLLCIPCADTRAQEAGLALHWWCSVGKYNINVDEYLKGS